MIDGKIHAIGGRGADGTTVTTHEVYDPATNTWKELAPLPKARDHWSWRRRTEKSMPPAGASALRPTAPAMHDIYDPKTNTWTSGPPLPTPRSGLAGTFYKGLFMVLGGEMPPSSDQRRERGLRRQGQQLAHARADAGRPPRHRRRPWRTARSISRAARSSPGGGDVTDQLIVFTLP